jgi:coproporphyrinogen III oxidase
VNERNKRKEGIVSYLQALQQELIAAFESLEPSCRFVKTPWPYAKGEGGGCMAVLRGDVFEKAAVNWSGVSGASLPLLGREEPFFATGVSLITHMHNPFAPTVHFNIRYIETPTTHWFGGGYDLTPMGHPHAEDTAHFHAVAKQALDAIDPSCYPLFREQAARYFYIPHRNKERGEGGIFFDHLSSVDVMRDLALWKQVGDTFLEAIMPLYKRRIHTPFTAENKATQLRHRAHYVEFNLLYDKGTQFGFLSGGNPEAILCSLPPLAAW